MLGLSPETRTKIEKKSSHFLKVLKQSIRPQNENVLIITDHGHPDRNLSSMLGYGYYHAAKKKNYPTELVFQDVKKGFMQVDSHIITALQNLSQPSIVILATSNKLGRIGEEKSFRAFCKERGHRFLSATGLGDVSPQYFDLFLDAMNVNYTRLAKKGLAIKKLWDKAKEIRVKTAAGTDLIFNVDNKNAVANIGCYHQPGEGGNMPAGEVYIAPQGIENVNGIVVIDGSIKTVDGAMLVKSPLTVVIENGHVVRMEGEHASLLEKTFQAFEDRAKYPERVRFVSELGIGINPAAVLIGSMIMDEKVLGTAHIAFGSNSWFGGDIKTIFHGDQVFKNPIFYVDGNKMEL